MQKALDFLMNLWYNNLSFGGIAQLGERLNGIQEVRGSTPLISTIGGVNEHPALYVCSTMFVLLLPLSAVR